jgi:hypothetical protein
MSKPSAQYKSDKLKAKEAVTALGQLGIKPTQNPHASAFIPYSKKASPVKRSKVGA